jgi:hypothetical protein
MTNQVQAIEIVQLSRVVGGNQCSDALAELKAAQQGLTAAAGTKDWKTALERVDKARSPEAFAPCFRTEQ